MGFDKWPVTLLRMPTCLACGQENPRGFRFCGACGAPLASPLQGSEERKVLTVLFCDLVGFTHRAERLDPEDVHALMTAYHTLARSELQRFGGTVEKFIGDAVLAFFGAPVAHDDDPERAVRAALAVRDAVGGLAERDPLEVRIGITTGEALVTLAARPAAGEAMAAGDVVNTAARLQAAAPVGGILVDVKTFDATAGVIEYRPASAVAGKGKEKAVPVWEALAASLPFGAERRRHYAPLVDRARELDILRGALERVRADRVPRLVTLIGVPGIGKTRLVAELQAETAAQSGEPTRWLRGRSLPYGVDASFWALAELVNAHLRIGENDSPGLRGDRLAEAVAEVVQEPEESARAERYLRRLVGLEAPSVSGDRRAEAFAAWRRFFEGLASSAPLVLVFEDLHFADDDLLDFVDHLIDWATDVPLLLLATARPELLARRPDWGGGKASAVTLTLPPLSDADTARLIRILNAGPLGAEAERALLRRAGGNALYAEEFARLIAGRVGSDADAADVPLPESVRGIVAARLDGLSFEEKAVLQGAAVVGETFWLGALLADGEREHVGEILDRLDRREFVRRERPSTIAGEAQYVFRHPLIRDVAYAQIPRARRVELHRSVAGWIEELGRQDDRAEMLAYHYLAALRLARTLGTADLMLEEGALVALGDAGDRASTLNAHRAAAGFYTDALSLCPSDAATRREFLIRCGRELYLAGDDDAAVPALEEARDALLAAGDRARAGEAQITCASIFWRQGDRDHGLEELQRGYALVRDEAPSPTKAASLSVVANYLGLTGDHTRAIELATESLALSDGLPELQVHNLTTIGTSRGKSGDPRGFDDLERAVEIARVLGPGAAARALNNLGYLFYLYGDLRRDARNREEARQAAERFGDAPMIRFLSGVAVYVAYWAGSWDECVRLADEFVAQCRAGSPHYLEPDVLRLRAQVRIARGELETAAADAADALTLAADVKDPDMVQPVASLHARLHAVRGETDEGQSFARELLASQHTGLRPEVTVDLAWAAEPLALTEEVLTFIEALRPQTAWVDAARAVLARRFDESAATFEKIGSAPDAALAHLAAAERLAADERVADATEHAQSALEFFRSMGVMPYVARAQVLLGPSGTSRRA
jgi:class 3 adenylate cyclase/tetratricopeptide (TPR) repeat protein